MQDATTPEYAEFEYPDSTFEPEIQEEEYDYPLTGGDPEFSPSPSPSGRSEVQPASLAPPTPSEVSDPQGQDKNEDVPLTSEPSHSSEPAARSLSPPSPPESPPQGGGQEQQVTHEFHTTIKPVAFVAFASQKGFYLTALPKI